MQTFVLKERKETEYVMNAKQPYRTPEGDMCDLDPNKICDNCMKCVNKTERIIRKYLPILTRNRYGYSRRAMTRTI